MKDRLAAIVHRLKNSAAALPDNITPDFKFDVGVQVGINFVFSDASHRGQVTLGFGGCSRQSKLVGIYSTQYCFHDFISRQRIRRHDVFSLMFWVQLRAGTLTKPAKKQIAPQDAKRCNSLFRNFWNSASISPRWTGSMKGREKRADSRHTGLLLPIPAAQPQRRVAGLVFFNGTVGEFLAS